MKKKIFLLGLLVVFVLTLTAQAVESRMAWVTPTLSFSGTTATCTAVITDANKYIDATMELWNGNTKIAAWEESGSSVVRFNKTARVESEETYTLKVYGTSGGISFSSTPLVKECP